MKGKIVSLAVVLLMVIGSYAVVGTKINVENNLDTIQAVPLSRSWPELAKAYVYSAGNKEDSCAEVTCYSLDDIECEYRETKRFQVHYTLDLDGGHLNDWAMCEATVNGETKYKEVSGGYLDALFLFDVVCKGITKVEWEVSCELVDLGWNLEDSCSGSLNLIAIGNLGCTSELHDWDARPGEDIHRSFEVRNSASYESKLDWEIVSWPDWGTQWSFSVTSGENLGSGCHKDISFSFTAPKPDLDVGENKVYKGKIDIVNLDNSSDTASVALSFTIHKAKDKGAVNSVMLKFLQAFPFLENLQQTYSLFSI